MSTSAHEQVLALAEDRAAGTEALYRDLHAHPELAFQERRTADEVARRLGAHGYEVHAGIGGTGVAGVLRNGDGPVVLLRADMDALPVAEETGLDYASTTPGVMHACGHDVHVACLLGAADLLASGREHWAGTVVVAFQPAEEHGDGARRMVEDGLFERVPVPDVVLAQHVVPFGAGMIAYCDGPCMAAADNLSITFRGAGGHGSRPETACDPLLMAAAFVQRVQGVVAREVAAQDQVVITVGSFHAGEAPNVIPDHATVQLSVRSFDTRLRDRVLTAVTRVARAEAAASGADEEPLVETLSAFPVTVNDSRTLTGVNAAFAAAFGESAVHAAGPQTGSEDVGAIAAAADAPLYYWWLGGWEPAEFRTAFEAGRLAYDIPSNHSPRFAPVPQPTLTTGARALTVAALDRLASLRRD